MKIKNNNQGIAQISVILIVIVIAIVSLVSWQVLNNKDNKSNKIILLESWNSCDPGLRVRYTKNGDTLESVKSEINEIKKRDATMDCDPDIATFKLIN